MATLTVQQSTESGAVLTFASCGAGGDVADNTAGTTFLLIKNANASDRTVTITAQNTSTTKSGFGTLTKEDATYTISQDEQVVIGPFAPYAFNNASNQIAITYDAVTDLTIAAVKLVG